MTLILDFLLHIGMTYLLSHTGDFLIVDPIEEGEKVKAEISFVLCKNHVRSLQKEGHW